MATFDEELQIVLDRHPEIEEVRVKYKKTGTVFKPRSATVSFEQSANPYVGGNPSPEISKVAEMLKAGEL